MSITSTTIDYEAIKSRQRGTWSSGNYAVIGTTLQLTGELLCEAVDISAGERVLDVAAGNGNAALAAARRGATVTASDYVARAARTDERPGRRRRLDHRRARRRRRGSAVRRRHVRRRAVDVRRDVHTAAGRRRRRAVAGVPAGWTHRPRRTGRPTVSSARCSRSSGATCRRPPASAHRWSGAPRPVSASCSVPTSPRIALHRRQFVFRYRSAEHWLDAFRDYYGPTLKAFAALRRRRTARLRAGPPRARRRQHNTSTTGALRVPSDYLEVVAVKMG